MLFKANFAEKVEEVKTASYKQQTPMFSYYKYIQLDYTVM